MSAASLSASVDYVNPMAIRLEKYLLNVLFKGNITIAKGEPKSKFM